MGIDDLHQNAYGLDRKQHERVIYGAKNNYTEAWLAAQFNITTHAVRDICLKAGITPPRNEKHADGTWTSHPCIVHED